MADLQVLRERREQLRGEIEKTRTTIAERRDNKDHKGVVLSAEERTAFDKIKTDFLSVKEEIEAEERAAEVDKFLLEESEAEQRSRRGHGGKHDPIGDDKLPGGSGTYGDRFGNDRDAYRQHDQAETRRALVFGAWAIQGRNDVPLSEEQRTAIAESRCNLGGDMLLVPFDTIALNECRAAVRGYRGDAAADRAANAVSRVAERRSVVAGAASQANLAPQVTVEAFEKAALTIGGLYNVAETIVTPTGAKMVWPTANDTANEGSQIDEVTAQSLAGVAPAIASFSVASYEFWSNFIRIGNVTLRDTPVALAAQIGMMIGERIARAVNRKATTGDGNGTLRGLEAAAVLGRELAAADTYTWQDLYHLKYSVDGAYRSFGSWMMNDELLVEMMTITDNNGRPVLIEPNDGSLPRLLNSPVHANNHMAAKAEVSDTRPALTFGDHSKYKLRLVGDVRMSRLVERFSEYDQTAFDGKRGADGGLLNAGGNPVKGLFAPPVV